MSAFAHSYGYTHSGQWATSVTSENSSQSSDYLNTHSAREQYVTLCVAGLEFPHETVGQGIRIVRVEAPAEASFSFADALTKHTGHSAVWTPAPRSEVAGAGEDVLNWELDLGSVLPPRSGTIDATLRYGGRGKPLVYEDPDEE